MTVTRHGVRRVARTAGGSRILHVLARTGFAASALIHVLIGLLALRVASHDTVESDQAGAIGQVAQLPGGMFLLWVLTVGLFALAAWLFLQAVPGIGSAFRTRWARTLESLAKGVAYLALALTALAFARGGTSNASTSTQQASGTLLQLPGGQLLLGAAGVAVTAVGGYLVVKGVRRRFLRDIEAPRRRGPRIAVTCLGIVGYVAKGIAIAVVGVLFLVAAITLQPAQASGLDGALKSLVALPMGAALLIAVGVGLMAFGLYTFVRARLARL